METERSQPYSAPVRVAIALVVVGVFGGLFYYAFFAGAELGEPCANDADCLSDYCLRMSGNGECTVRCGSDDDCPDPLTCVVTPVEFSRGPVAESRNEVQLCRTPWSVR